MTTMQHNSLQSHDTTRWISIPWRCVTLFCCLVCSWIFCTQGQAAVVQLQPLTPTIQRQSAQVFTQEWSFQCLQLQKGLLQFQCPAFGNRQHQQGDVELTIQVLNVQGAVQCIPLISNNHSDLQTGDQQAQVVAWLMGTGSGRVRVTVRLKNEEEFLPAGDYTSSLNGTIIQQ
jgi:hypothetical protein